MGAPRLRTLAAALGLMTLVATPAGASASVDQLSIIQDSTRVYSDPARTLATFRALGASTVRVIVDWAQIAPDWKSATPPPGFDAADPADYPAARWGPYDAIV